MQVYLDLARIFLLLRFSLRIRFLRHWNKLNEKLVSINKFPTEITK